MSKNEKRKVMPSMDLLSEMECLEIHGGAGGNTADPDDFNGYCHGAYCATGCGATVPIKTNCAINSYCGSGVDCS